MQRYTNLVQDNSGNALGGVTVSVYDFGTSNLSTLYNANGTDAKVNPFVNDSDGTFEFYAASSRYDIVYTKTGYTFTAANYTDLLLYDRLETGLTYASPTLTTPTLTTPTISNPVLSGSVTGTYTIAGTVTITAPILSGSVTGTYTLAGTPTITSPTISSPTLSGTVIGTYTLAGTPTITSPAISSPTLSGTVIGTYTLGGTPTLAIADGNFTIVGSATASKVVKFENDSATASTTLTLNDNQTTSQTLNIPDITATDTLMTLGLAQTVTGVKTMTNMTAAAGTTAVPSITLTGGTKLTSAVAGAVENDAIGMYLTTNTTDGRAHIPARQHYRLTADGSAITTIDNFFGANSNISLVASAYYQIEIVLWFLKTTSDTVVITLTNSAAPTSQNITWMQSPITGLVAPPGTATWLFGNVLEDATAAKAITTGSLTSAQNHYIKINIDLINGTGTSLKIQATSTSGSVTPQSGSYWTALRIPTGNTGTFAA